MIVGAPINAVAARPIRAVVRQKETTTPIVWRTVRRAVAASGAVLSCMATCGRHAAPSTMVIIRPMKSSVPSNSPLFA